MSKHMGFTLVELLVVIMILGILAAAAIPKLIDIWLDAENTQTSATALAVTNWGTNNYAAKKLGKASAKDINHTTAACTNASSSSVLAATTGMFTGDVKLVAGTPATQNEYTITGITQACNAAGIMIQCRITHKNGTSSEVAYVPCTN